MFHNFYAIVDDEPLMLAGRSLSLHVENSKSEVFSCLMGIDRDQWMKCCGAFTVNFEHVNQRRIQNSVKHFLSAKTRL